jgi:predicted alpha/beta hydrolase
MTGMTGSEALPAEFVTERSAWCQQREYFMDGRFDIKSHLHHDEFNGQLLSLSFTDDAYAKNFSVHKMASYYPNGTLARIFHPAA